MLVTALIGVEDFRCAVSVNGLLHGLEAEIRGRRVRRAPGQHPPARPVHHGKQIDEAAFHREVGNVGGKDLDWVA